MLIERLKRGLIVGSRLSKKVCFKTAATQYRENTQDLKQPHADLLELEIVNPANAEAGLPRERL